jgi:hypothetical protein
MIALPATTGIWQAAEKLVRALNVTVIARKNCVNQRSAATG